MILQPGPAYIWSFLETLQDVLNNSYAENVQKILRETSLVGSVEPPNFLENDICHIHIPQFYSSWIPCHTYS